MTFDERDYTRMVEVERKVGEVLARMNEEQVEAGIVAFALVRLARGLLNQYPQKTREMLLLEIVMPFLAGEQAPENDGGKLIRLH